MPRKKKYVSVKKYRKGARRIYRRKYMKKRRYKRTVRRLRGYHRKRRQKKIYNQRKFVGIKWTRYLSLSEFLKDDKWDLEWLYSCAFPEKIDNVEHRYIAYNKEFASGFGHDMIACTSKTWTVPSSEIMTNKYLKLPFAIPKNTIVWKAYSPTPSFHNLGPMFNQYCNLYKKMKYIGMKVKWRPGQVATTSIVPSMGGSTKTVGGKLSDPLSSFNVYDVSSTATVGGQSVQGFARVGGVNIEETLLHPQLTSFSGWNQFNPSAGFTGFISLDENTSHLANTVLPFQVSPLDLRLWVNFDKQGYEGYDFDPNPVKGYHVVNPSNSTAKIYNSRVRFREIWTEDGLRKDVNSKLIKSYSLRKPFKFFVRPKIARPVKENPENETVLRNAEDKTEVTSMVSDASSTLTELLETNKRMSYLSVMQTYPKNALGSSLAINNDHQLTMQIYKALQQDLFFDPILFGWCLTCDNLPVRKNIDLFGVRKVNNWGIDSNVYFLNNQIDIADNLLAMGKFKVTYYCRFRDFQHIVLPEYLETANAVTQTDEPSVIPPAYDPGTTA